MTTGGTAQDWIAVAMLLTPTGGKGKNALQNNITDTPNNKKTPTEADTPNNKKDDENASVKPKNTTFTPENQNKKGEAYEEGSKKLLDKEGNVDSFGNLKDDGMAFDDITGHHMPSNEFMKRKLGGDYNTRDGIAMNMEHPFPGKGGRHRQTATYDNNMTKAEQELYWNLSPREALAYDIKDAIKIYKEQGLYNDKIRDGLLEVIKQNKTKYPNLFQK